jgi:23S rRNA pseudouridine1911/1915/1917 synthase
LLSTGEEGAEGRLRAQTGNSAVAAVHRLDRDTSGCLLLARDAAAAAAAIAGFEGQAVRKMYHALVVGRVQPAEQTVRLPLEGRPAITHLKVLDANAQASHLLVRIETGRTHQIRKHLAALRHPVLGDRAYGARRALAPLLRTVERHMLHASALEWRDPYGGAWQRAQAPLPADFKAWLRRLRLT